MYNVLRLIAKDNEAAAKLMANSGFIDVIRGHAFWHHVGAELCLEEILNFESVLSGPNMKDAFFKKCASDLVAIVGLITRPVERGNDESGDSVANRRRKAERAPEQILRLLKQCFGNVWRLR